MFKEKPRKGSLITYTDIGGGKHIFEVGEIYRDSPHVIWLIDLVTMLPRTTIIWQYNPSLRPTEDGDHGTI